MSRNIKFRWFHLTVVALLVVVSSSVISSAGELENAQEAVRQNPNDAKAHYNLGNALLSRGNTSEAISHYKKAIVLNPDYEDAHYNLKIAISGLEKR